MTQHTTIKATEKVTDAVVFVYSDAREAADYIGYLPVQGHPTGRGGVIPKILPTVWHDLFEGETINIDGHDIAKTTKWDTNFIRLMLQEQDCKEAFFVQGVRSPEVQLPETARFVYALHSSGIDVYDGRKMNLHVAHFQGYNQMTNSNREAYVFGVAWERQAEIDRADALLREAHSMVSPG